MFPINMNFLKKSKYVLKHSDNTFFLQPSLSYQLKHKQNTYFAKSPVFFVLYKYSKDHQERK